MQYAKQNTLKAFFSFFFLWATILFSYKTTISATESSLWIANNVAEKEKIETAFNIQKTEDLHLFSHGKSGELWLDGTWKNAEQIAVWLTHKQNVQQQNQLNVYGCEFAKGKKGKMAVRYLENTLGICVAAFDDIAAGIGGDWELEVGRAKNVISITDYEYNLQCNCKEFIYLNEPFESPSTRKVMLK